MDDHDSILNVNLARAEMYRDFATERIRVVNTLTTLCLRTLLLFNGGAIIALFTVLGRGAATVIVPLGLTAAFTAFSVGAFFAMLATGLAFFNQNFFWAYEAAQAEWLYQGIGAQLTKQVNPERPKLPRFATILLRPLAIALCWASLAGFGLGAWSALQALRPATPPTAAARAALSEGITVTPQPVVLR